MARIDRELPDLQPGRFVSQMEAHDVTAAISRADYRASFIVLAVAAALVLLVMVIGIIGLAAFTVAVRARQLGIRRAIGACRFHILRYFLVESWIITTSGALLGCILPVVAGLELSSMYHVSHGAIAALLPRGRRAAAVGRGTDCRAGSCAAR